MAAQAQLAALGDPTRRTIFERIARKPMSVVDVAAGLSVSRPAVSQHLVRHTTQGTRNVYQINARGVEALRAYVDALWSRALADFKAVAEASYQPKRRSK